MDGVLTAVTRTFKCGDSLLAKASNFHNTAEKKQTFYFLCTYVYNTISDWTSGLVGWSWVNFQFRGVLLIWMTVGQGSTALAVGAGGGCLDIFSLVYHFSFYVSLSLGDGPV